MIWGMSVSVGEQGGGGGGEEGGGVMGEGATGEWIVEAGRRDGGQWGVKGGDEVGKRIWEEKED